MFIIYACYYICILYACLYIYLQNHNYVILLLHIFQKFPIEGTINSKLHSVKDPHDLVVLSLSASSSPSFLKSTVIYVPAILNDWNLLNTQCFFSCL